MNLQNQANKIGRIVLLVLFIFGISMVLSDIHAPFTTNAYLQKKVTSITSEVPGIVDKVYIKNGSYVNRGDPIFSINKSDLVENKDIAYANMLIIQQHLKNIKVEIELAKTQIKKQQDIVNNNKKHFYRYKKLYIKRTISQDLYDDAKITYFDSKRELEENLLELHSKEIKLGVDGKNGALMLAKALLARSERKIEKSITYSPSDGRVTNLQLNKGKLININAPQVAITSENQKNVIANFNEKALPSLNNANVLIVFDAIPGTVFLGKVTSTDTAVQFSQHSDNDIGQEAFVQRDERWIRQSQQVRTIIDIENTPNLLVSGSKATVMIKPKDNNFWSYFADFTMGFISLFRYIY